VEPPWRWRRWEREHARLRASTRSHMASINSGPGDCPVDGPNLYGNTVLQHGIQLCKLKENSFASRSRDIRNEWDNELPVARPPYGCTHIQLLYDIKFIGLYMCPNFFLASCPS
jgi:hypothetical protein